MDMKELAVRVKNYYCDIDGRGDKYIERALVALSKAENHDALLRAKVEHSEYIDEKNLFCEIDEIIAFLTSLKKTGYTSIYQRWSGYEDNYFVAVKISDETDDEYHERLADTIAPYIEGYLKEDDEKESRKRRIRELEQELQKLKGKEKQCMEPPPW